MILVSVNYLNFKTTMQIQSCVLTLRCAAVPGAAGDAGELDAQLGPQRRPAQLRLPFEPPSGFSTLPGQSSFLHTAPDAQHAICTICKEVVSNSNMYSP